LEQAQDTAVLAIAPRGSGIRRPLHFGESHQLVDWYHAKKHLIAAARLMKQDGTAAFTVGSIAVKPSLPGSCRQDCCRTGQGASKGAANAAELTTAANYFRTNQHRMNYIEMREEEKKNKNGGGVGPIGSGMV